MITTFNGSRPACGETIQRNSTWNGDASTLGAPGEEPEYGAGDPERILATVPGTSSKPDHRCENEEEEMKALTQISLVPGPHAHVLTRDHA